MKCKEFRPLFMDFIYDEISETDRRLLLSHLEQCEKCRTEIESLKNTSKILQLSEDIQPDFNLTLVTEKNSWAQNFRDRLRRFLPAAQKLGLSLGYGVIAVLLFMAISNTEISYQQGNFSLRMGLFSKNKPTEQTELLNAKTQQVIDNLRQENYYLTKTLIEQSEARQRQEWAATLTEFNQTLEQKRLQDLNLISNGLVNFERNTNNKLQRTDNSLNELLRHISMQK